MRFAIVACPRSRTAWLANLLTTDKSVCYHEPLSGLSSMDELALILNTGERVGVSDTMLGMYDLKMFDKVVVVHRPYEEICQSLKRLGLNTNHFIWELHQKLPSIRGLHIQYQDLAAYKTCREIYQYCLPGEDLSLARWTILNRLNVQCKLDEIFAEMKDNREGINHLLGERQWAQ